ncbi:unnamed protein product [Symbiodinium natans]|uniref:Uncharacterized protein n=1 Tax=Symbiodinium natans TaxID=878477 RepID=A0A812SI32_9DINO|nr:unnamed protein product [Symbiodinium natans]
MATTMVQHHGGLAPPADHWAKTALGALAARATPAGPLQQGPLQQGPLQQGATPAVVLGTSFPSYAVNRLDACKPGTICTHTSTHVLSNGMPSKPAGNSCPDSRSPSSDAHTSATATSALPSTTPSHASAFAGTRSTAHGTSWHIQHPQRSKTHTSPGGQTCRRGLLGQVCPAGLLCALLAVHGLKPLSFFHRGLTSAGHICFIAR